MFIKQQTWSLKVWTLNIMWKPHTLGIEPMLLQRIISKDVGLCDTSRYMQMSLFHPSGWNTDMPFVHFCNPKQ